MNFKLLATIVLAINISISISFAEDGHDHSAHSEATEPAKHTEDDGHDHSKHSEATEPAKHTEDDGDGHEAHDNDIGHSEAKAIGKGKAIVEIDEKKGFRLSKEAIRTIGLKLKTVDSSSFNISKKALVTSKNKKGVYRFRAGFFKFLPAKIIKKLANGYTVKVNGVDFGDQIVINGVGILRVTDVYSTDKSEYGHSH